MKNHDENEGMLDLLIENGLVEPDQVTSIRSGYLLVAIHRMTDKLREFVAQS